MEDIKRKLSRSILITKLFYYYKKKRYESNPEKFIKEHFEARIGYKLNLKNPKTYNEKLQWLKLYWRDETAEKCADKYKFRNYVKSKGLEKHLINLYGVYENPNEIDFSQLPNKFVLKSTHASGQVIICKDKTKLNWKKEIKKMEQWLKLDYYYHSFEWVYENVKPRIICESLIETSDGLPPKDYKIFCFNGIPKLLFVASDRIENNTKFDFYDCNWNRLNLKQHYPNSNKTMDKPEELEEMLNVARMLSEDFPHARVDFYIDNGTIIVGEITFFHFSGNQPFEPFEYDVKLGECLELPNKYINGEGL